MEPERIKIVNSFIIREYYWAGKYIVFVDNNRSNMTFEQACDWANRQDD